MRPPRLIAALLGRLLPETERDALLGDLEEEFHRRAAREGPAAARGWYRRQALASLRLTLSPTSSHDLPPATLFSMGDLLHELRFALRQLRRRPLYAGIVVLTLAVGIGATSAVLSVANPVLFRPLPYPDPDRLVLLGEIERSGDFSITMGYPTFTDLVRDVPSIESGAALSGWGPILRGESESEQLFGQSVSASYFKLLGVRMLHGRDFTPAEDSPGQNRVVVLGHGLWRRRFGGDPAAVGRTVTLGPYDYTIIGVLPSSFESLLSPESQIWRPLAYNDTLPQACRTCRHLRVIARLKNDTPREQTQAELATVASRLQQDYSTEYAIQGIRAESLKDLLVREVKPALLLMLGAGLFVLAIACANVGNLVLARTTEREHELTLRSALGAGQWRLIQQLIVESAVLCLTGAAAGLLLAKLGLSAMIGLSPADLPRLDSVALDWRIVLITLGATMLVALVVAVVPGVLSLSRATSPVAARSMTTGRRQRQLTAALVVTEISLAFMLLSGAGLLTRSLSRVLSVEPGFEPSNLLTMSTTASGSRYQSDTAVWLMQRQLLDVIGVIPEVESVALASQIPLSGDYDRFGVVIEDQPLDNPEEAPVADRYTVSPGYLEAMRIPLRRGRGLTEQDRGGAVPVALINENFARLKWSGTDPIGKRIRVGGPEAPWRTIVGVVGDVKHIGLDDTQAPQFYTPSEQWMWAENGMQLVIRTSGEPIELIRPVRAAIASVDPAIAVSDVATAEERIAVSVADRRLIMRLFEAFAGVALLLAAAGIYGLLSRRVAERHRELGIRSALGATRQRILGLVTRDGGRLALIGVGLGFGAALGLSRLLEGLLFNVAPRDPVTLSLAAVLLGSVALVACLVPAWRAARVDPIEALRSD